MNTHLMHLETEIRNLSEYWSPKTIAIINGQSVNIAKLKGRYQSHTHDDKEKFFQVIFGTLYIEFIDQTVTVHAGECVLIEKRKSHTPYTLEETGIVFFA